MLKPEIRERLFRWVAVPALAGVLALLAVLQYQWSGRVSAATRAQMQTNLQVALMGFRMDFARELGAAGMEIRSALDPSGTINPTQFAEQFQHWQQTAAHPNLVEHIYVWQDHGSDQPLRFDPGREQLEHVVWPAEFESLRQHLQEVSLFAALHFQERQASGRDAPGYEQSSPQSHRDHFRASGRMGGRRNGASRGRGDFLVPMAVDQSIPALAYPVRQHPGADQHSGDHAITWLIIQLNKSVLQKEIFPELAQKYFRGQSGLNYHVAVRASDKAGEQVVYASDAGFGGDDSQQMDASLNLFGPPMGRGAPNMGPEMFLAPMRSSNDRSAQGEDRRAAGPERLPRLEVFHSGDQSVWQVVAKHKSGSVEAAVNGLRRRNLMASFAVLVLLGLTMALILIASQRARRLARLQMDFVAGVSHELRTPLAVISSAAENIAHGVVEDKQQLVRYGNSIVKQTRQLTQLVEQVLLFAATQQAPRNHNLGPVNLYGAVEAALEGTATTVAAAGVTVERRIEPGLPAVSADFNGLVQSLQNLIINAVKYGGESRWLRVAAETVKEKGQTKEIILSVEDKGIGISKDEIKHIFEPFYRSPAIAESGIHGTGLGLPLARKIVEAMGGQLTAESEVGKGSLFSIHLQVAEERAAQEQHAADRHAEPDFSS